MNKETYKLYEVAKIIRADWKNVWYGAEPYLAAMETLESVKHDYFYESGKSIVLYFLSNATTWRGEKAKEVKAYLKAITK
jgi:sulfatase maturation enzyme AslB (radical SAM superfamily)